jgi:hypothetical protein
MWPSGVYSCRWVSWNGRAVEILGGIHLIERRWIFFKASVSSCLVLQLTSDIGSISQGDLMSGFNNSAGGKDVQYNRWTEPVRISGTISTYPGRMEF